MYGVLPVFIIFYPVRPVNEAVPAVQGIGAVQYSWQ